LVDGWTGDADGSYSAHSGVRAKLSKVVDGWELAPPDRRVLRFDADGKQISITAPVPGGPVPVEVPFVS
jgi:hypothetical protein